MAFNGMNLTKYSDGEFRGHFIFIDLIVSIAIGVAIARRTFHVYPS